ncbi:MAG: alpha/beta hydrolase [Thermoleophilia bacterium]|nr:alpha/beta hydrolase [Thermoleophilia bacterium]
MPNFQTTSGPAADAAQIYYEDFGTGDPVVLIHGWPLSSRSWEPQLKPLVDAGHRVITYDRRGFGDSSQVWTGYDYDTFAADLDQLLTELDLVDVTLVGFSMGGGEIVRYLANYGSQRVRAAVLASAVPPYLYASEDNPDGSLDDATIQGFLDGITSDRAAFLEGFMKNFFSVDDAVVVSDAQVAYGQDIARFASAKGTLDSVNAFSRTDFRADVAKVDVPTLVIHGDSDVIVPFEASGKRSAELIADAQLHVIEGAPHGCNVSHTQEFNEVLLGFLQATAARSKSGSSSSMHVS